MKLTDLMEQYPITAMPSDIEATLPPVAELPDLDNSNNYQQYRFQTYMAAARAVENGDVPFKPVVPWEQYLTVVGYTPQELETVRLAAKQSGMRVRMLNTSRSHEPEWVNTKSPVANLPPLPRD